MITYESSLSKNEVFQKMNRHTQKAFFVGNEGSGVIALWRRGDYFELTWPSMVGQTSFCGTVKTNKNGCTIKGMFLPNHYMWIYSCLMYVIVPPIAYWASGYARLPAYLSVVLLSVSIGIHFVFAPDIGKRGNEIVEEFIEQNLLS